MPPPRGWSCEPCRRFSRRALAVDCQYRAARGRRRHSAVRSCCGVAGARRPAALLLSSLCGGWAGAALTGWLLFPLSARASRLIAGGPAPWLALLSLAFAGLWALSLGRLQPQRTARAALLAAAMLGAMLGAAVLRAQRADAPATRPLGGVLPDVAPSAPPAAAWSRIGRLAIQAARGELALSCGGLPVEVMPLLTFESRSPDRG